MEEGDLQTGISVRLTASPEGADIDWDGLDQLLLSGDNAWPQVAIDASIFPGFFAPPSILLSDATATTATTNICLGQPSITMASEAANSMDLDQLLSGDSPWLKVATIASSSTSFFASSSQMPQPPRRLQSTSTCFCLGQPDIAMAVQGATVDLDTLEQLLSADSEWLDSSSPSPSLFASPSVFPSDAETTTPSASPSSANTMWIQMGSSSVRERFEQALAYIKEAQRNNNVLVQVWVAVKKSGEGQLLLTTAGQPFTLDMSSDRLKRFRDVSTHYHFSADVASEHSPAAAGLTTSVYMGKLPQWSPDVQCFTSYEWPRVRYARDLGVHGTLVLPVFEKGNYSCLGVIELITTAQKLNFTSELNTICSALQAVNLRSTEVSSIPRAKFSGASYKDALPEILEVLRAACLTHKLPLAQTWTTCAQQGKRGSRHSDENYQHCISTIDAACYVNEPEMQNFHDSCSDHHLLRDQGVTGKAFATNQPCFLPDIGSSAKLDYPLSHHAKIFNLKGAVAIRLRCTRTGTADFVLEFFLPTDCGALEEQKAVLEALSVTMQNVCRTLRTVTDKELEDDAVKPNSFGLQKNKKANKRKPMAPRSTVWKSFTKVMVGDTVKAKCNYCDENYCCESKNGTSSLISHLKRCKLNPNKQTEGQ